MPPVPKDLDKAQALRWYKYCGELMERQLLFETDLEDIARLCKLESQLDAAISKVEEMGVLFEDKGKEPRRNSALMAQNNIYDLIGKLKKALALGPTFRNKLPGNESGARGKDGPLLALEKRIREEHTPQDAEAIIKALNGGKLAHLHGSFPANLRTWVKQYREELELDREFDI